MEVVLVICKASRDPSGETMQRPSGALLTSSSMSDRVPRRCEQPYTVTFQLCGPRTFSVIMISWPAKVGESAHTASSDVKNCAARHSLILGAHFGEGAAMAGSLACAFGSDAIGPDAFGTP